VQTHRRPRGVRVLAADGIEDRLVLQVGQVRLPRQPGPGAVGLGQAVARDQRAAQVRHHLAEIQVAGGLGDQQVEAPVGFDAAVAGGGQVLIVVQRLAHLRQVPIGAAQGGQRGSLAFQADAQLQQVAHAGGAFGATRRPAWAWRSMTKVPMPWRGSTRPEACNLDSASRTTVRLMPCSRTRVFSEGKRSPGLKVPSRICWVRLETRSWARLWPRLRGCLGCPCGLADAPVQVAGRSAEPSRLACTTS
jgi:hypothetical protein